MTSWGTLIIVVALFVGLKRDLTDRQRYGTVAAAVFVLVAYAAVRQHTY